MDILDRSTLRYTFFVFFLVSIFILATLLTTAFPWAVFWPTFFLAGILILAHPRSGLFAIILLTMIWERYFTLQSLVVSGRIVKLYPLDIILLLTAVSFFLHWLLERHHRKLLHDPHAPSPSLLTHFGAFEKMLLLFALFSAVYFFRSQIAGVREPDIGFSTFKNYAFYMLLTFLVLGLIRTRAEYLQCMRIIFFGAVGIIAFIIIGVMRGGGLWTEFTPLSTAGVRYLGFPHAYYLTVTLLIMMSVWFHRLFARPLGTLFFMGIYFVGILGSLMRHLWIAFFAGIIILVGTATKQIQRQCVRWGTITLLFFCGLLFVVGAGIIFFPESVFGLSAAKLLDPLIARVTSFSRITEDLSALWRLKLWQTTFVQFIVHPFFGIGFGQEITFDLRGYVSTIRLRDLHNSFFGVLVQMGIVGFTLFVGSIIVLVAHYLRRRARVGWIRPWADGVLAAFVAVLLAANFQPYLETNILSVFFWILLGLLRVAPFVTKEEQVYWSHLRLQKHLKIIESVHRRGGASL